MFAGFILKEKCVAAKSVAMKIMKSCSFCVSADQAAAAAAAGAGFGKRERQNIDPGKH